MVYRKLALLWLVSTAAMILALLSFGAAIDPLGMLRPEKTLGTRLEKLERLYKPWAVYWTRPRSLALGNSRFYYSLDMNHPGWRHPQRYNLSLTGATIDELAGLLRHAVNAGPVDQVVVAVDGVCDAGVAPQLASYRLLDSAGSSREHALWLARDFLSPEVLGHAMEDLMLPPRNAFDNGRALVFDEYQYRSRGQTFVTEQREMRTVRDLQGEPRACTLNSLEQLLDLAYTRRLDLKLVINPYHVRLMRIEERMGGLPHTAQMVLEANQSVARRHDSAPFPLWYFATLNSVTTDPLADAGAGRSDESPYWYEPSHYRKNVGDWILDRVLETSPVQDGPPADFGVLLTAQNIDTVLRQRARDYADWVRQHPAVVAQVDRSVDLMLRRGDTKVAVPQPVRVAISDKPKE
jgi:hypothetical protein